MGSSYLSSLLQTAFFPPKNFLYGGRRGQKWNLKSRDLTYLSAETAPLLHSSSTSLFLLPWCPLWQLRTKWEWKPVFLTLYSQHLCGQNQKLEIWSYAGQFIKLLYIADFICRTEENSFTYCQNCDAIEVGKYFETNHRKSRISYFHPYLPFLQS